MEVYNMDLDAVIEKPRTIKYNGRDVLIKGLNTEQYLEAQAKIGELMTLDGTEDDTNNIAATIMKEYLMMVIDITEDEAINMDNRQFRVLREYLDELDLLDQGFTPEYIKRLKEQQLKNRMEQISGSLQ
jgi:hypothetical protein